MTKTVAVLATLDTKGHEAEYLRERIGALGGRTLLVDLGVVGDAGADADVERAEVAAAGGTPLAELLRAPTRQEAVPVMVAGAIRILAERVARGDVHAVLGLGGTQGTPTCAEIMRALPYGLPKVLVSTIASGDVGPFVDIKDVTMMFSVSDILGLNPLTRKILANAAAAAHGMACAGVDLEIEADRPAIGMTNLGTLTAGAMRAIDAFTAAGHEVITFHAVGSGGRAMEQLMKEGVIGAVFDYALGEIADELFDGLRAGGPERLTVAGGLGLPQVICPGGAEHVGLLVEPNTVPERWASHAHVFHNPVILAPRLGAAEMRDVAREIATRLTSTRGDACLMVPTKGTSRYAIEGGPLHDPDADAAFLDELRTALPKTVELVERQTHAEDPAFVEEAVKRLVTMVER